MSIAAVILIKFEFRIYSIGMLLLVAAYTDIKEKEILNINLYLISAFTILIIISDYLNSNLNMLNINILLVSILICILLNFLNLLGTGDTYLIASSCYLLGYNTLIFLILSAVIGFVFSFILSLNNLFKFKKFKFENKIAFAPSLFFSFIIINYIF